MAGHLSITITCAMTPKDLRQMADEMERRWSRALLGDDLTVREWHVDNTTRVIFTIDQEQMHHQYGLFGQGR